MMNQTDNPPRHRRAAPPRYRDRDYELSEAMYSIIDTNRAMTARLDNQTAAAKRSKWLLLIFLFGPMLFMVLFGVFKNPARKPHVGVIEIDGVIMSGSPAGSEAIIPKLERCMNHKASVGCIAELITPGGSPVQSNAIRNSMIALREKHPDKKIIVVGEDVMASGGYLVALGADKIYADSSSIVGSIGSVSSMLNVTELMSKVGVKQYVYTSGDMKSSMSPFSEPEEYQVERLNQMLVGIHDIFKESVLEARDVDETLLNGTFWLADEALELGFIDGISNTRTVAVDDFGVENLLYQKSLEDLIAGRAKVVGQSLMAGVMSSFLSVLTTTDQ